MSETKEIFAEKTIRSLKNILYRYMEEHGYKNLHKLSQFVKILNSKKTSKFYIPEQLQFLRILDDDHIKSLHSPSNPTLSPKSKIQLLQNSPEEFIRFLSESIVNLLHGNLQDLKKRASLKKSKRNPRTFFGQINLERKTKNSVNKKGLTKKNNIPIRH